jgi:hypothetical protein
MTTETKTICDVCKAEGKPQAGDGWASLSVSTGWYGPHRWLTRPHHHKNDSASRNVDVCSAVCALAWLRQRIESIEANAKAWTEHEEIETRRKEEQLERERLDRATGHELYTKLAKEEKERDAERDRD